MSCIIVGGLAGGLISLVVLRMEKAFRKSRRKRKQQRRRDEKLVLEYLKRKTAERKQSGNIHGPVGFTIEEIMKDLNGLL